MPDLRDSIMKSIKQFSTNSLNSMNYDEILKCYEGHTELHANTSFEFGLMNETYYMLFRDHDLLEYATLQTGTH